MFNLELLMLESRVLMVRLQITSKLVIPVVGELQMLQNVPVVILSALGMRIRTKPVSVVVATSTLGNHVTKLPVPVNANTTHVATTAKHVALGTMAIRSLELLVIVPLVPVPHRVLVLSPPPHQLSLTRSAPLVSIAPRGQLVHAVKSVKTTSTVTHLA